MNTECVICRAIPERVTITTMFDSGRPGETFPPEVGRLQAVATARPGILKCPRCGTYYRRYETMTSHMGGPDHDLHETVERCSPVAALIAIGEVPEAKEEVARLEAMLPEVVADLKKAMQSSDASVRARAATDLTLLYLWRQDAVSLEAIIRNPEVRDTALQSIPVGAKLPENVIRHIETMLDDPSSGSRVCDLLVFCEPREAAINPIIKTLLARLDADSDIVRGRVCRILGFHLTSKWRGTGFGEDLPWPPGASDIVPVLIRHLAHPQYAPTDLNPQGKTSTFAAEMLLALASRGEDSARNVFTAVLRTPAGAFDRDKTERELRRMLGMK